MTFCDLAANEEEGITGYSYFFFIFLLLHNFQPSSCSPHPEGDFRVAQVAQDEVR